MKATPALAIAMVVAAGLTSRAILAQSPADAAVKEVRTAIDTARKEVDAYKTAGGAADAADHPAIKWDSALWAYRERYPRSEASTLASAEAIRLLGRAELWDRAHARVASLDPDDPAWVRVASPVYEEGIARKDLPYTIDTLSHVVAATTNPSIKSTAGLITRTRLSTAGRPRRRDARGGSRESRRRRNACRGGSRRPPLRDQIPQRRSSGAAGLREAAERTRD